MKKLIIGFLVVSGVLFGASNAHARVDVSLTNYVEGSKMTVYGHGNSQISCIINNDGHEKRSTAFVPSETCYMRLHTFPITLRIEAEQASRKGITTITIEDKNAYYSSNRPQRVQVKINAGVSIPNGKVRLKGTKRTSRGRQGTMRLNWFTVTDTLPVILQEEDFIWFPTQTAENQEAKNQKK